MATSQPIELGGTGNDIDVAAVNPTTANPTTANPTAAVIGEPKQQRKRKQVASRSPDLSLVLHDMIDSNDLEIKHLGLSMKSKFDSYWGDPYKMNRLIFIACVFDPTAKLEELKFSLQTVFGNEIAKILEGKIMLELKTLYEEYRLMYDGGSNASQSQHIIDSQLVVPQSGFKSRFKARFKQHRMEMGSNITKKTELEMYLDEPVIEDEDVDVLKWWKQNQERFSILSKMARDILAVPISTVASESAFSTGGRVLDCFRSSLTPKLVEALICTQDWLRPASSPLIIEETLDDVECFEKEHLPNVGCSSMV